jgi:hypothetical protein
VRTLASDAREFVILGHYIEVYLRDEERWHVAVDGEESLTGFADPYAAWAAGAAESYRLGRTLCSPPSQD